MPSTQLAPVIDPQEPQDDQALEARIAAAASRFDVQALRELLGSLGYQDNDIEYRSHPSTLQQSAAVAAITFVKSPRRHVIVAVNLGWLAPQTPLPNYFQRIFHQQSEPILEQFLNFFAHHLLRADTASSFPERDRALFADWNKTRGELRSLLGLRSLSTIHWVFGLVYPEMEVAVRRSVLQRTVRTRGMVLGTWAMGDGAACGGVAQVPVSAVAVTLLCDEAVTGAGRPWASEAAARLHDQAFAALFAHGSFLHVLLVLRDQSSFMVLNNDRYLGYEPIAESGNPPLRERKLARSIVLWSGEVPAPRPRPIDPDPPATGTRP